MPCDPGLRYPAGPPVTEPAVLVTERWEGSRSTDDDALAATRERTAVRVPAPGG